jgi:hypothetical protein
MPRDTFADDNEWQRSVRDAVLAPGFYGRYAVQGRYVFIDKGRLATVLQRKYAVDTVVQGSAGRALCIEEKIVRWKGIRYKCICLETHSCTTPGRESDGWMRYGMADYLLYCLQQKDGSLQCYLIDFPLLREWFWPLEQSFTTFGPLPQRNGTFGRLVPIADINKNVPTWFVHVEAPAGPLLQEAA